MKKEELRKCEKPLNVRKANSIIQSIGRVTLLANKVFMTALIRVQERNGCEGAEKKYYEDLKKKTRVDFSHGLVAEFSSTELRSLIGDHSGSFYKRISDIMDPASEHSLARQWGVYIRDQESGLYGYVAIVTAMLFDRSTGRMFIKFSDEESIKNQIYDIRRGYTLLNYRLMMSFSSIYTYRVYELLLSSIGLIDYSNSRVPSDRYAIEYGLSELKYRLGILDPYITQDVREAIAMARTAADFEKIERDISSEVKMPRYKDFERYVLVKAIGDLNSIENPEYTFSYEPIRSGRGGKVVAVRFIVERVKRNVVDMIGQERSDELFDIIDEMRSIIHDDVRTRELMEIAETAGFDIELVKKAYKAAKNSKTQITNLVGFLIMAIKKNYDPNVSKGEGKKAKNDFLNIPLSDTDYDKIAMDRVMKRLSKSSENTLPS